MPNITDAQLSRDTMLESTENVLSTAKTMIGLTIKNPHIGYELYIGGEVKQNTDNLAETQTELKNSMDLFLLYDNCELIFQKGSTNKIYIASIVLGSTALFMDVMPNKPRNNAALFSPNEFFIRLCVL